MILFARLGGEKSVNTEIGECSPEFQEFLSSRKKALGEEIYSALERYAKIVLKMQPDWDHDRRGDLNTNALENLLSWLIGPPPKGAMSVAQEQELGTNKWLTLVMRVGLLRWRHGVYDGSYDNSDWCDLGAKGRAALRDYASNDADSVFPQCLKEYFGAKEGKELHKWYLAWKKQG